MEDVLGEFLELSTRTGDTAIGVPIYEDHAQDESAIPDASAASGLAIVVDKLTDEDKPMPADIADSDPSAEQPEIPVEPAPCDRVVGIPLAGDVPLTQTSSAPDCMLFGLPAKLCSEVPNGQVAVDSASVDVPMENPVTDDDGGPSSAQLNNAVRLSMEPVVLPLPQDTLENDSALDVDLADYYAAFPDFGDARSGTNDIDSSEKAVPSSESFADDLALSEYDLPPSSPPPSSSPPHVFSSPGPASIGTTPSSSPPGTVGKDSVKPSAWSQEECGTDARGLKRSLEERDMVDFTQSSPSSQSGDTGERSAKRVVCFAIIRSPREPATHSLSVAIQKTEDLSPAHTPPNPTRPTPASQARQRKKLAAPFRSPVIKGPLVQGGLHAVYATGRAALPSPPRKNRVQEEGEKASNSGAVFLKPEVPVANKDRTANVAKQFKSPLQTGTVSSPGSTSATFSSVKAGPTIQALQGKVQTLKQAIRIKKSSGNGDEDEVLEGLVEKWTTAAREIAWAVWDHVKDLDPGTAPTITTKGGWFADDDERSGLGAKRGFDPSWGYDDGHVEKRARMDGDADGGLVETRDGEEEPQVVQHTLGVMLRRLGIDPATLGWDEEEGDFVDVEA